MRLVSIGADPELFVTNNGTPSSAIGKLGGSKHEPRMIKGYGIQEDNVLAEFSMPPVMLIEHALPRVEFIRTMKQGIETVRAELKKSRLSTTLHSSHSYNPRTLRKYGKAALEFGCDPDMNAYTGLVNPAPDNRSTLRTAGGHVHVGYHMYQMDNEYARMVAKSMDLFLGVPSVLIDPDQRRREMYGKAGAYRLKSYGIEYRTLSNFWIHSDNLIGWVFDQSRVAVEKAHTVNLLMELVGQQAIQDCINTGDKALAEHIIQTVQIQMPQEEQHAQAA